MYRLGYNPPNNESRRLLSTYRAKEHKHVHGSKRGVLCPCEVVGGHTILAQTCVGLTCVVRRRKPPRNPGNRKLTSKPPGNRTNKRSRTPRVVEPERSPERAKINSQSLHRPDDDAEHYQTTNVTKPLVRSVAVELQAAANDASTLADEIDLNVVRPAVL